MKNPVVQKDVDEFSSVLADLDGQPSLHSTSRGLSGPSSSITLAAKSAPSYQPYSWGLLNRVLDIVDDNVGDRTRANVWPKVIVFGDIVFCEIVGAQSECIITHESTQAINRDVP